jgi:Ubiquitin fold domain
LKFSILAFYEKEKGSSVTYGVTLLYDSSFAAEQADRMDLSLVELFEVVGKTPVRPRQIHMSLEICAADEKAEVVTLPWVWVKSQVEPTLESILAISLIADKFLNFCDYPTILALRESPWVVRRRSLQKLRREFEDVVDPESQISFKLTLTPSEDWGMYEEDFILRIIDIENKISGNQTNVGISGSINDRECGSKIHGSRTW